MTGRIAILTMAVLCSFAGGALGERRPKDTTKLSADEVRKIYSGKTSNWSRSNAYFSPDGSYFLVGKNGNFVGKGDWTVSDNAVCASFQVRGVKDGGTKNVKDCWTWFKQGKKYWTFWSGEKDKKNGYYDGEMKKLSKGDKVTKKFQQLTASN